jgi:ABC-type transport system involved in cytochrome c biogenesis permease component
MTFLPIVAREMRVSARKASTYWVRFAAAAVALAIGGYTFMFLQFAGAASFAGQMLFGGLVGLIWIYAALGGVFKTADALSEEKREGTLGLLFLTDLKGYDIVLGKIVAASVNWFFGLFALFPILALSLLMGGVAPGEFWRKILGLTNLLFYSLAIGMFVSALARHERRAATLTLVLLLILMFAPNFLLEVYQDATGSRAEPSWLVLWDVKRPMAYAGDFLFRRDPAGYWSSLAVTHGIGWMFLLLASLVVPHTWQVQAGKASRWQEKAEQITYGRNRDRRQRFRQRALDLNPFYWVASRARGKVFGVMLAILAIMAGFLIDFWVEPVDWKSPWSFIWPAFLLHSILKVWITFEACRRFVEDRKSGALELVLSTPMTPERIVRGQWRALMHQFGLPVLCVLLFDGLLIAGGTLVPTHFGMRLNAATQTLFVFMMVAGVLIFLADLIALAWLSMWRGMNARHSYTAFLWSSVQLLLFPWIVFYVAMTAFFMAVFLPQVTRGGTALGRATTQWMEWMPFILTGIWFMVSLGTAVFSVWWARKSLKKYFRYQATAWYQPAKAFWPRRAKPGKLPPRLA